MTDSLRRSDDAGYSSFQVPGYPVSTPRRKRQTHGDSPTFESLRLAFEEPQIDLQAPSDDSVSNALGALSLGATSLPRSGPASYRYQSDIIGDASGQDSLLQSSLTNRISATSQIQSQSQAYRIDRGAPPPQQSAYSQVAPPQNESGRELSRAERNENSIVMIGNSEFNATKDYLLGKKPGKKPKPVCRSSLAHRAEKYYGAIGLVRESSPHAIANYKSWKKQARKLAKGEKKSSEALKPKGPAAEASSSSGKSRSPAYHEERRERHVERERRDQPAESRGSKSGDGSKHKDRTSKDDPQSAKKGGSKSGGSSKQQSSQSKDTQSGKSQGRKSGSGRKPKDRSSKDDTHEGGRHREHRR